MIHLVQVDERGIGSPIEPDERSGDEARIKWRELVDERKAKVLFDHPLNFCRGAG
jgi:hypothetical protein